MNLMKRFWREEEGMGTVEIVMIIAALMYLVVVIILTKLLSMFEGRLAKSDRR